jgi:hypothetical protein
VIRHLHSGRVRTSFLASSAAVLAVAVLVTAVASARTATVPQNTSAPMISGTAGEGNTLTASNGSWSGSPTAFAYQWRQCDAGGSGCSDIVGATKKTYTLTSSDVDHTLRVVVTASNADGQASATSDQTQLISSKNAPVSTVKPAISGTDKIGEELSATTGTWTGGATSFSYQWQRCSPAGVACVDVVGATGNTYGVRSADAGNTVRVEVTAKNASGSTTAASDATGVIQPAGSTAVVTTTTTKTTTTTVTQPSVTPPRRIAPGLSFLSLKRLGIRAYARFKVCDHSGHPLSVIEHDLKFGVRSFTRRFTVNPPGCGTFARSWIPAARFRSHGKYTVTLKAVDRFGLTSSLVSRSLFTPAI